MLRSFPWHCLESPDETDNEALVLWIYAHFASRAYQSFMELGPGLLVGPFLSGEGSDLITNHEALARRQNGRGVGLTVTYVAVNDPVFELTLPDPALRAALLRAAKKYNPEQECVILTLVDNTPHLARIAGATSDAKNLSSPKVGFEALKSGLIH